MKTSFNAPAAAGAGALLCALFLTGCGRPSAPPAGALDASAAAVLAAGGPSASDASDPLAAAKSSSTPAAETQAAQDVRDNSRSRALAVDLAVHPDWLARQDALCGPGNAALQVRYAALKGRPPQDLRDLKVACMAKDIAEREGDARTSSGGVKNTGSL